MSIQLYIERGKKTKERGRKERGKKKRNPCSQGEKADYLREDSPVSLRALFLSFAFPATDEKECREGRQAREQIHCKERECWRFAERRQRKKREEGKPGLADWFFQYRTPSSFSSSSCLRLT